MSRSSGRRSAHLSGGPWANRFVKLGIDRTTLPFSVRGQSGRYVNGTWEPAKEK